MFGSLILVGRQPAFPERFIMSTFTPPPGVLVVWACWVMGGSLCEQAHGFVLGTDPAYARRIVLGRLRRWHSWRDGYKRVAVLVEPTSEEMYEACEIALKLALASHA